MQYNYNALSFKMLVTSVLKLEIKLNLICALLF